MSEKGWRERAKEEGEKNEREKGKEHEGIPEKTRVTNRSVCTCGLGVRIHALYGDGCSKKGLYTTGVRLVCCDFQISSTLQSRHAEL